MSEYQVIARKWRPQKFSDVVGQEHVVRTLKNAIVSDRTAHAYLFVGPRGVGKTTLARIFAKAMNCLDPQQGEPCCRCASCLAIADESSLDVIEIDAASRNSASDMRELSEDVMHQPVAGKYKIYIIDEVHMLSKQAWNALLKTVEEPPRHIKFIFATTEVHQVLPTIISRCQRFDLLPIPTRMIAERLRLIADTEKVNIDDAAINAIARAAEGGMRDAQSLLDQMISFFAQGEKEAITGAQVLSLFGLTDRTDLDRMLSAMLHNEPGVVVKTISALAHKGKNLETLFDDLLSAVRGIQLCTIVDHPEEILDESDETLARYRQLASDSNPRVAQILLETIAPVGRILHDALNKQIFLETILLKAMREAHAVQIDDLIHRLNQLRSAGELQFLEQLPAEVKTAPPVTVKMVETTPEPVKPEIKPEPVNAEVKTEIIPPPPAPPVIEAVAAPAEPEPVAEIAAEIIPQAQEPETAPHPQGVLCDGAQIPQEEINFVEPDPVLEEALPPLIPAVSPASAAVPPPAEKNELKVGARKRKSIIHDDPEAVEKARQNPVVREIADLFNSEIIDIHQ